MTRRNWLRGAPPRIDRGLLLTFVVSALVAGGLLAIARGFGLEWPGWIAAVAVAATVFQTWAARLRPRRTPGSSLPESPTNRDNLGV
ncbi:hypothetical protein D6T64_21775 [Cryobacterium melibiosiphilum]|uniref:Uncharacterized protein n=1 Tax=Cryobacterium melibiosiphilum TaxID=995039 RepID=A0A3A5M7S2_9MICO|nr:hypothetical protein [Cryobacterium melibiosiphilum]RJT84775.1 hypothetical protein D6T64_21775 [Cryobacterium melibiosiphilum]